MTDCCLKRYALIFFLMRGFRSMKDFKFNQIHYSLLVLIFDSSNNQNINCLRLKKRLTDRNDILMGASIPIYE